MGNGDGTFQPKTDIALALTPVAVTVGDFNGDGIPDLVSAGSGRVQLGLGDKTGQSLRTKPSAGG